MTGCHTCGGFGDRHDPVAHEVESGRVSGDWRDRDVQDLAALDYAETALSECWAALREIRDWDAAAAQRHGGIGVREFAAQFLDAHGFASDTDAWDEADYRRDGDQALTALAASIRDYRRESGQEGTE